VTWVRRDLPEPHTCDTPPIQGRARPGWLWRCDECQKLWQITYGFGGHYTQIRWAFATVWQRIQYWGQPSRLKRATPAEPVADVTPSPGEVAEGACANSDDGQHCVHWWDGDGPCCRCGSNEGEIPDEAKLAPGEMAGLEEAVEAAGRAYNRETYGVQAMNHDPGIVAAVAAARPILVQAALHDAEHALGEEVDNAIEPSDREAFMHACDVIRRLRDRTSRQVTG
jgi:hypothetical protein